MNLTPRTNLRLENTKGIIGIGNSKSFVARDEMRGEERMWTTEFGGRGRIRSDQICIACLQGKAMRRTTKFQAVQKQSRSTGFMDPMLVTHNICLTIA
ncbi:hypothetical protein V6N13_020828 [Hibiscus sabdariffa]|uniref:Uncharacterized protein n=1 Tax=Hibiscus sabdariffa TaxID=183260 RepID=A0ABR2EUM8_9ROSI